MKTQEIPNQKDVKEDVKDIPLPKRFEINFYDEYMQITRSWFRLDKLIGASIIAILFNGLWISEGFLQILMSDRVLLLRLFSLAFIVMGISFIYILLVTIFNKTQVYASENAIQIKHQPLPWIGNKRIETKNIEQFFVQKKFGLRNNGTQSVKYILKGLKNDGSQFNLITGFENGNQALYIEQELEKYLGIENEAVSGEINS